MVQRHTTHSKTLSAGLYMETQETMFLSLCLAFLLSVSTGATHTSPSEGATHTMSSEDLISAVPDATTISPVTDFDYSSLGFEFVFHEKHNLLLIINGDKCYFARISDLDQHHLANEKPDVLKELFIHIGRGIVKSSTLGEMRDAYGDLLADFRCYGKHIFTVDFNYTEISELDKNNTFEFGGLKIVFHDEHDLLVTIFNNACYYSPMSDAESFFWNYTEGSNSSKIQLLAEAARVAATNSTNLTEMAQVYHDLVAEFDCYGKEIYTVELDFQHLAQRLEEKQSFNDSGMQLFFHGDHDLLLAVKYRTCYYAGITGTNLSAPFKSCPMAVMEGVTDAISMGPTIRTTLAAMERKFQDRLANYLCTDPEVYTIELNATFVQEKYDSCLTETTTVSQDHGTNPAIHETTNDVKMD